MSKEKNKLKTFSTITKAKQKEFKDRYLSGESIMALSEEFGVKRTSAQYYASKLWKPEKQLLRAELFQKFSEDKRGDFIDMSQNSIIIIKRALQEMATSNKAPSIMEAKRATEILEAVDKITRLDDGKPTDITEERPTTIIELKEKLALDPFQKIEDAEYKEIEENDKKN